ncbi:MAG: MaoC family dehydratase N-terminal domain-containing protein [Dehalococcoidia bacterium]|nr:MaoC family dehydratase N-terminal domain-containing protein [Dehalococcoidia bacterium]
MTETYLDLHVHSTDGSDDAGGSVEGYLKWATAKREQGFRLDGFVLTEHRRFDLDRDYSDLAARYDTIVLPGVEVETDIGHVLVFGVTPQFLERFDLTDVSLPYAEVFRAAWETGGVAVAAHAGRPRIGLVDHYEERAIDLSPVTLVEALNGGSSDFENARGHDLAAAHGLREVGASDSHFVSALGRCMTRFDGDIRNMDDLVAVLRDPAGAFLPVRLEETKPGAEIPERPTLASLIPSTSRQGDLGGDALEYDRSAVGREVHVGRLEVTPEAVRAYCEALDERNPLYVDEDFAREHGPYGGLIAPPGLLQTARLGQPPDPKVEFGNSTFMGGSRQEYFLPIRPGDVIDAYAQVKEVYEKTGRSGRMAFVVRRTRYVNQHGEDVATTESSLVHRQVRPSGEGGEA